MSVPILLPATYHDKPWGRWRDDLKLGEIWCRAFPLLLKFIFTSELLSVQVHPGDEYAVPRENSLGKTECWYIIAAEPAAQLAIGLNKKLERAELLRRLADGAIEQDLCWLQVHPGDFIFVPWGTVHAIGPGITLCEVQEFSDLTYRMYDWRRQPERALHLDRAVEVIRDHPSAGRLQPVPIGETGAGTARELLVACRHFVIERYSGAAPADAQVDATRPEVLVFIDGEGELAAGGDRHAYHGEQMWYLPETAGAYRVEPAAPGAWLRVYAPRSLDDVHAALEREGVSESERRRIVIEDV